MLSLPLFLLVPAYLAAASPIALQGQAPQPRTPNVAVIPLTNPVYHRFNARAGNTKSFNAAAALKEKEAVRKKHGKHHSKRDLAQKQKEDDGAARKGKDAVKNDAAQKGKDDRKGNDAQKGKDNTKSNDAQKGNQDTKKGKDDTKNNAAQKGKDDTKSGTVQKGKDDDDKNASAQKGQQDEKSGATKKGKDAAQKGKDDTKSGATKKGKDDTKNDSAQKGKDDTKSDSMQKGKDNTKSGAAQKGKDDTKSGATKKGKDDTKSNSAQKGKDDTKGDSVQKGKDNTKSGADQKGRESQNGAERKAKGTRSVFEAPEPFDIKDLRRSGHFEKRQNSSGNAPLTNDQAKDYAYYGPVSVGTPAQNTTVLFDTGSSDLILPLSSCTTCVGPLFASNLSSTFHDTRFYFDIEYLDGSGSRGTVAYDRVSVAGLSVANQSFGAIRMESNNQGLPSAGIMGMGFPPNAQTREAPFFFNLANGSLASNAFSFYLSRDEINGSELCLGCLDSTKFNGTVAWYPLEVNVTSGTSYWWNIASDGISVNGSEPTGRFEAIIDSGTSLIYVPPTVAADLYRAIPDSQEDVNDFGTGFYTFPCDNALSLPPISFLFGGVPYEVHPADFNLGSVDIFGTRCVGGIVGLDIGLQVPAAIIGVEFMKAWYSVFDLEGMRVGFAPTFGP